MCSSETSITPTATPPSSPEIRADPPSILMRSAAVRNAFLGLRSDAYLSDSDDNDSLSLPPAHVPHTVCAAAPTDEECGLRPPLDLALENIDPVSEPIVSFLRNMPPAAVVTGHTRPTVARALAHYLNVSRAQGAARAVLLVSRTNASAKAWQEALVPVLDRTLEINVANFFMAKAQRSHTVNTVSGLRFPGVVLASEKGLRSPVTKPGIAWLTEAIAQNPHGIKWDLVVSDAVGRDEVNDEVSPLRMLANCQAERALVVLSVDDKRKKGERLTKRVVEQFLDTYGNRIRSGEGKRRVAWCTPESLKVETEQTANDEKGVVVERNTRKANKKLLLNGSAEERKNKVLQRTLVKSKSNQVFRLDREHDGTSVTEKAKTKRKQRNNGFIFEVEKPGNSGGYGLDSDMEREMDILRLNAAAAMRKMPRANGKKKQLSSPRVDRKRREKTAPSAAREAQGMGLRLHSSGDQIGARGTNVPKRKSTRIFISDDILEYCTHGSRPLSADSDMNKAPRQDAVTANPDDDDPVIIENSDGEQEVFYDAVSWVPNSSERENMKRVEPRKSASRKQAANRDERVGKDHPRRSSHLRQASGEAHDMWLAPGILPFSCTELASQRENRVRPSTTSSTLLEAETRGRPYSRANRTEGNRHTAIEVRAALDTTLQDPPALQKKRSSKERRRSRDRTSGVGPQSADTQKNISNRKEGSKLKSKSSDPGKNRERRKKRSSSSGIDFEASFQNFRGSRRRSSEDLPVRCPDEQSGRRRRASRKRSHDAIVPQVPNTAEDVVVLVDSADSDDGHLKQKQSEILIVSDDDTPKGRRSDLNVTRKERTKKRSTAATGDPSEPARKRRARKGSTNEAGLSATDMIRQDIHSLPTEDRRRYNDLIARARREEGKGPEGLSTALQLYLQGMDIYEGDDFLTTRILALSSAKHARNSEDASPWDRPASTSPIAKDTKRRRRRRNKRRCAAKNKKSSSAAGCSFKAAQNVIVLDD